MSQFDYIAAFIGQVGHATTPAEISERLFSFMAGLLPSAAVKDGVTRPAIPWKGPAEWLNRQATCLDRDPTTKATKRLQKPVRRRKNSTRIEGDRSEDCGAEVGPPDGPTFPPVSFDRRTMTVSLGDEAVELSPVEFGMVSLAATCAIGRAMQLQGRQARQVDRSDLTPRERECLQWAAIGKSEWEISQILGISEHTSEKHLLNAKTKLGATNRVQAVAEAIRRGYIN